VGKVTFFIFVLVFCCLITSNAQATLLTLSTHASNGTGAPTYDLLDATVGFSVLGDVLDVMVTNQTGQNGDPAFVIDSIYFNADQTISDLTLFGVISPDPAAFAQWSKDTDYSQNGFTVDGFGDFDTKITDGGQHVISAGETYTFRFTISGTTGPYSDIDFSSVLSDTSQNGDPMFVAAHFAQGPGGTGGYGATNVPEPATICLLSIGAFGLLRSRRIKL